MLKDILNKKLIVLLMGAGLTLTSCFDDDSKDGQPVSDITIADFEESTYTKVSYMGQKLEINPSIETEYPESDLEYLWTIVPVQDSYSTSVFEQPVEISTEKNLSYEVSIAPKDYTVCLKVSSKSNGYAVTKTATLTATTLFSQGFYILKETADGNSELDMLLSDGSHSENLLSQTREDGAMEGKPMNLTVAYSHNYINTETNKTSGANIICVVTDKRNISAFRSTDLKEVFNQDNMFYYTFADDEIPYGIQNDMNSTHYFSNKGAASVYSNASSSRFSGKYGTSPTETGGSTYIALGKVGSYIKTNQSVFYWDQDGHSIYNVDFNGDIKLATKTDGTLLPLDDYDCVMAGYNTNSGSTLFVFQNKDTKDRVVYELNGNATLKATYPIDASKHIAKSDIVRLNSQQAYYMYSVDDNKLYGYDWTTGNEIEMPLQGIGSGETINYVSNQFINPGAFGSMRDKFDQLVIGTTSGNNDYHLYFYNMVGGQPDGDPVLTTSGTGRVNNIRYITPNYVAYSTGMMGNWVTSD